MTEHYYHLHRPYQFSPAAVANGASDAIAGWVVTVVDDPGNSYGIIRYMTDEGRVAWKESAAPFEEQRKLKDLFVGALSTQGAHHKQWYLWRLAAALDIDLAEEWNEHFPKPEEGIAP